MCPAAFHKTREKIDGTQILICGLCEMIIGWGPSQFDSATDIWSLSTGRRLDTLNRWRKTQERENNCNLFRLMSPVVPGERGVSSHDKRKLRSDWILEEPKSQRKGLVSLTVLGFYSLKLRASSW